MASKDPKKKKKKDEAKGSQELPDAIMRMRTHVNVGPQAPENTSGFEAADSFAALGIDNSFSLKQFKKSMSINVTHLTEDEMEFDLIGVDASLANAFRRILIAEVPTMAIEKVRLFQNTSVIPDEVLVHRVGLLPLRVDPRLFQYLDTTKPPHEKNTLVFTLDVKCTRNTAAGASDPYVNGTVMSSAINWVPQGKQEKFLGLTAPIIQPDIVLAKLRPGQSIEFECHAVKGIGASHSKWSPVATASYRLLPEITLLQPVVGDEAKELVGKCPLKVFDIEELGGVAQARVTNPRSCSMCRECIRSPGWDKKVRLERKRDHFIFSVESTGAYSPEQLFRESVGILASKCKDILENVGASA